MYNDCLPLSVLSNLLESSTKMTQFNRFYAHHTVVTLEDQDVFVQFDWSSDNEDGEEGPVYGTMKVSAKMPDTDNPMVEHWVIVNNILSYKQWDKIMDHIWSIEDELKRQTEEYL